MATKKDDATQGTPVQVDWNQILGQFEAGGGDVLYMKGKIRARILPFTNPNNIFYPVNSIFRGKTRTKYLLPIWHLDAKDEEKKVKAILLSKRDCRSIIQLQMESWELFDPKSGHAVSFSRSGTGTQSSVLVTPSPKEMPIPPEIFEEAAKFDVAKVGKSWSDYQAQKAAQGEEGENGKDAEDAEGDDY